MLYKGDKQNKCHMFVKSVKCYFKSITKSWIIHTGDKPYKCDICVKYLNRQLIYKNIKQYTVTSQANVTDMFDKRIHTSDRPYKINVKFVLNYFLNQVIKSPPSKKGDIVFVRISYSTSAFFK